MSNVVSSLGQEEGSQDALAPITRVETQIGQVMRGQSEIIRKVLSAWIAGAHVLLEDFPGTGKTTLAKALARSVDARFSRIQFTPDLLPSDIVGVSIWNQGDGRFCFHEGPVFASIVLADEINRASPRTQSALLEAMAESQVTVDGVKRGLPLPYFVIATQNPVESHGVYPLPEAQLDRFGLRLSLGYVSNEEETQMLEYSASTHPVESLSPCASLGNIRNARDASNKVAVSQEIRNYIVSLVAHTRKKPEIRMGASPRASITIFQISRALAFLSGRDFVTPDDVQDISMYVLPHRLVLDPQTHYSGVTGTELVRRLVAEVPVPV
ncbi:MoxR-like ATPase [Gammaproteobacteria bacterium]